MKVKIQTLKNAIHEIDFEEGDTVGKVRDMCEQDLKLGAKCRIIHNGQVLLDDTATLGDLKMQDGTVLVIIPSKKKAGKKVKKEEVKEVAPQTPVAVSSTPAPAVSTPVIVPEATSTISSTTTTAPSTSTEVKADYSAHASNLVVGPEYEGMVANLMALGFSNEKVVAALKAAFNNPDRAADYLFNGIPNEAAQTTTTTTAPSMPPAPNTVQDNNNEQSMNMPPNMPQGGPSPANIMAMLQQNPQMLPMLIQQISESNPELAQQISQNPEQLMQLLQHIAQSGGEMQGDMEDGPAANGQPETATIYLTQEERDSVNNLVALGFPQQAALQAFVICDRNEELAANFLFDNMNG